MKHTQSKKIKVEDHPKLKRDVKTTAIVNTDEAAYERYINDRNVRLKQKNEIDEESLTIPDSDENENVNTEDILALINQINNS